MRLYRDFETVDDLNWQYLPSKSGVDGSPYYDSWPQESEAARGDLECQENVPFGPTVDEYLDIFPAKQKDAPVHLFIHGGYWRVFSAKDFSFVARELVAQGIAVVLNNYALCPKVTMDEVVRQNRAAVKWLVDHAADFGGDPGNITVSGHSAGGHLTAMTTLADWKGEYGLDGNPVRAAFGISGLYDLGPFPYTDLQSHLQLTREQIERNSPIYQVRSPLPPVWLVVGADETPEFHRQSDAFAQALDGAGNPVKRVTVEATNHFSVMQGFKDQDSELFKLIRNACLGGTG
jgi:arylformamidase